MKAIIRIFRKIFTLIVNIFKRGTFALPRDEFEKLEVLHFIFKTFTILLVIAVLICGVWLTEHEYPSWTALLLFALRLFYALPAKRVERKLCIQQAWDREKVRAVRAKSA